LAVVAHRPAVRVVRQLAVADASAARRDRVHRCGDVGDREAEPECRRVGLVGEHDLRSGRIDQVVPHVALPFHPLRLPIEQGSEEGHRAVGVGGGDVDHPGIRGAGVGVLGRGRRGRVGGLRHLQLLPDASPQRDGELDARPV
jgi:hypothetical protein